MTSCQCHIIQDIAIFIHRYQVQSPHQSSSCRGLNCYETALAKKRQGFLPCLFFASCLMRTALMLLHAPVAVEA